MSMPRTHPRGTAALAAVAAFLALAAPALAQTSVLDEGAVRLTLQKIPDIPKGTAVLLQGTTGPQGDRFFIEHLNVTQTVSVILMAARPETQPLALNLSKYRFDQSDRKGSTGSSGMVAYDFRTQGELKIAVRPQNDAQRAPYFLIVWVSDDLEPGHLRPPVVSAAGIGGRGTPTWLLLAGAAIGGAILLFGAMRLRRTGQGSKMALFFLAAVAMSAAPISLLAGARPLGSLAGMHDAVSNMGEREAENAATRREINESGRRAVDEGLGHLGTAMDLYESSRGFTEADAELAGVLNPDDNAFDPDFDPDGAPGLPGHCATEGGEDCGCYDRAYRQLNFVRFYLERLRAIYGATDNYTRSAIAFGDSMSGLHGGVGLAWPPERKGIQDAFAKLGRTYDEKYDAYMRGLREALEAVSACEQQHYGVTDWYNRYGFVYYSFMRDRYKR
jgi:hypothetical protein